MSESPADSPAEGTKETVGESTADNLAGDAVTQVFVDHRELLFSIVYNMLGSVADTEDVLQETWLAWAPRTRRRARRSTNPRAYLVRIAVNHALARQAAISRRRETYVGPWLPEPLLTDRRRPTTPPTPAGARRVGVDGDAGGPGDPHPAGAGGVRPARGVRLRPHRDRRDPRPQPRRPSASSPTAPASTSTPAARATRPIRGSSGR